MQHGQFNRAFRLVWNAARQTYVAVAESARGRGKCVTVAAAALLSGAAWAQLPTGGQITSGSGQISQNGNVMTITQDSARLAANWQSFSIGQGHTVNFVQPGADAIALNRVVGSDVSSIQGALNANGQVFLINPNGVLFTPTAQVNVGGLVASTLPLSDADFSAGRWRFSGDSTAAVVNQGQIQAALGGGVALVAARIQNDGQISAPQGQVLMGAGGTVTVDFGGPVKLQIENERLQTLIQNRGAVLAPGGTVWMTSQAAADLTSSVINHSGVIEAQALQTGETGEVVLFAHGGHLEVSGSVRAAGGFVETSGKTAQFGAGLSIEAAHWLIDPVNVTIDSTLASAIGSALASGDVTITTDGGNTPDTAAGEAAGAGDITVDAHITWSTNRTLTLSAHNDIHVNADIDGGANGGVIFLYGQGSATGETSAYHQASGATVNALSQQWRKGSDLAGLRYGIVGGNVFIGGQFIELGLDLATRGGKFGTSNKPSLFFGRQSGSGVGMVGDADGFGQGADLRIDYFLPGDPEERFSAGYEIGGTLSQGANFATGTNNTTFEILPVGTGDTVTVRLVTTLNGTLQVEQQISLKRDDKLFDNQVTLTNVSGAAIDNARFIRSFDPDNTVDMGGDYTTTQRIERAIAAGDNINAVSATSAAGDAYAVASGGNTSKIVYLSSDERTSVGFGGNFFGGTLAAMVSTAAGQSKGSSETDDTGMGILFNAGTLGAGQSASFNYLTLLDNRDMDLILNEAGGRSPVTAGPQLPTDPLAGAQVPNMPTLRPDNAPPTGVNLSQDATLPVFDLAGGLAFVSVPNTPEGTEPASQSFTALQLPDAVGGADDKGFMRVFVLGTGINLEAGSRPEADSDERRRANAPR